MSAREVITLLAPACWASALINCDPLGLDPADRRHLAACLADAGLSVGEAADCRPAGFCWQHAASGITGGAECALYSFLVTRARLSAS